MRQAGGRLEFTRGTFRSHNCLRDTEILEHVASALAKCRRNCTRGASGNKTVRYVRSFNAITRSRRSHLKTLVAQEPNDTPWIIGSETWDGGRPTYPRRRHSL